MAYPLFAGARYSIPSVTEASHMISQQEKLAANRDFVMTLARDESLVSVHEALRMISQKEKMVDTPHG
jgi:hypothetical protein